MRDVVASIEGEFHRYRKLGEGAFGQVADADLLRRATGEGNSMVTLIQHLSGNFRSRFTDFLTTDGEKPWRDRESEFAAVPATRQELRARWDEGWAVLLGALSSLTDADLSRTVTIRGEPLSVRDALHRSLSHASYHVGQMVMLGRSLQGSQWRFLTIPPGRSAEYNRAPSLERTPVASASVPDDIADRILRAVTGPAWHGPALNELLADVTPSEAAAHPAAGLHTIAEIVSHLVFWCDDTLKRLPSASASSATAAAIPEPAPGADFPPLDSRDADGWPKLRKALEESHRSLAAAARVLSPDRLPARVPGRTATFEDMLRGVTEHAAYHGGQIAILRRSLREKSGS